MHNAIYTMPSPLQIRKHETILSFPVFQPQKTLQHIAGIMITVMNHNYRKMTTIAKYISKSHLHLEGFLSFPLCDPISLPHFQGHLPGVAFSEVAT